MRSPALRGRKDQQRRDRANTKQPQRSSLAVAQHVRDSSRPGREQSVQARKLLELVQADDPGDASVSLSLTNLCAASRRLAFLLDAARGLACSLHSVSLAHSMLALRAPLQERQTRELLDDGVRWLVRRPMDGD
jgi:hypothetical protein